jgi:hypothetical protein
MPTTNTFLPVMASMAPRLAEQNDFPSPEMEEVSARTADLLFFPSMKSMLVRNALKDSDKGERGFSMTGIFLLSRLCSMCPRTGIGVCSSMLNCALMGAYFLVLRTIAGSIILWSDTLDAKAIPASERFCNRNV